MSQSIYTFSVSDRDKKNQELVEEIKAECRKTGRSFSFVCVEALRQYKEAKNEQRRN